MSRPTLSRSDRVAQMTKQEELIAKKRQEILEKQRTAELAKAVAAAQNSVSGKNNKPEIKPEVTNDLKPKLQNTFCNDGSFLTHFKKILESAKKEKEVITEKNEMVEQPGDENNSEKSDMQEETDLKESEDEPPNEVECTEIPDMSTPPPATLESITIPDPIPQTASVSEPEIDSAPAPHTAFDPAPYSAPPMKFTAQTPMPVVTQPPPLTPAVTIPPPQTPVVSPAPPTPVVTHPPPTPIVAHHPPPTSVVTHPAPPTPVVTRPPPPAPVVTHPPPPPLPVLPSVYYPPPTVPTAASTNTNPAYLGPPNMPSPTNLPGPLSKVPPQNATFPPPPYFNPNIPPPILKTPAPPPPPPPPVFLMAPPDQMQLNNIPPPEPLQLSNIPPPKELDLNAIPNPEMNLDAIKIPENKTDNNEQFLPTTLESLIELVAENGDAYEDNIRTRKNDVHPSLWFLFDKDSDDYINYRKQVLARREPASNNIEKNSDEKYDPESVCEYQEDSDDEYMKDMMDRNFDNLKRKLDCIDDSNDFSDDDRDSEQSLSRQRKRKSRWGGKVDSATATITAVVQTNFGNQNKPILSAIQRTDPALLQYARQNYGTTNLTEEDWRKCEEHFKVNLLYQDMMRKREEIDRLAQCGTFKYEYDSDEDTTGGTWEHKLRTAEMEATQAWADALTRQSEGKHHIGDFLPPEELKKFMEKYDAKKNNRMPDLSDYKEYKLKEDNIGFQMLQKLGWKEGQGLGASGDGIVDPVNKAPQRDANQGLGAGTSSNPDECDNEYEAYRKRMMLAYRFRPNPLNNPRRAYY